MKKDEALKLALDGQYVRHPLLGDIESDVYYYAHGVDGVGDDGLKVRNLDQCDWPEDGYTTEAPNSCREAAEQFKAAWAAVTGFPAPTDDAEDDEDTDVHLPIVVDLIDCTTDRALRALVGASETEDLVTAVERRIQWALESATASKLEARAAKRNNTDLLESVRRLSALRNAAEAQRDDWKQMVDRLRTHVQDSWNHQEDLKKQLSKARDDLTRMTEQRDVFEGAVTELRRRLDIASGQT